MELFFKDPIVQIIDELNAKNSATLKRPLTATDLIFTEVSSDEESGAREVIAQAAPGSTFFGTIKNPGVTYHRYPWSKLFVVSPRIWGAEGESYDVLITRMASMYNLPPFTIEPAEGDTTKPYDFSKGVRRKTVREGEDFNHFTMQVTFYSSSIGYVGTFSVDVYNIAHDLGKIIKNTALDALTYPDDTKGNVGSLSTLTYPIEFTLPATARTTLSKVGNKLETDVADPLVKAIVDEIMEYYNPSNAGHFERVDIEALVAGSTVASTTITDSGSELPAVYEAVLDSTVVANSKFIGKIYIRNPEFLTTTTGG